METIGQTIGVCNICGSVIPVKKISRDQRVYFIKYCPDHGVSETFVHSDTNEYIKAHRFTKPAWIPEMFRGDSTLACPDGCGFCDRHEQHLCMPIIEITSRCDLSCPCCINASGSEFASDITFDDFRRMLDSILMAEKQIDVLNISGGEPLLHPQLLDMIDEALSRKGIVRVSLSTNGLQFLSHEEIADEIKSRNVVVSLQFDGFNDKIYNIIRGRPLLKEKLRVLKFLKKKNISMSLTMTAVSGINDDQFPEILDLLFSNDNILSLMIQPIAFTGRGADLSPSFPRLTIPEVIKGLDQSHPNVKAADFIPLPCSHPLCFSLAFYLMTQAPKAVAINRIADIETYIDSLSNRVVFGLDENEHQQMQDIIYNLWSGPAGAVPDNAAVLSTLKSMLKQISSTTCSCFDPRKVFNIVERSIKSIFIHAFQDSETFDLARVRRCCQAYPQPDGRLIPACAHNVIHRKRRSND